MTSTATLQTTSREFPAARRAFHALIRTDDLWSGTVLRVALGAIMLPHGLQKTFGLFGGYGFEGTMGFFTETMGLPWLLALLVIGIEFLGSIALIAGAGTRVAAAGIGAVMVGAVATVHAEIGFFMNWTGTLAGEGFEYHLLAIAIAGALILVGGGRWSLDHRVASGLTSHRTAGAGLFGSDPAST